MKKLPPLTPPESGGGLKSSSEAEGICLNQKKDRICVYTESSPLLVKEGVGGGCGGGHIHNIPTMKSRRKALRNNATPAEQQLWAALKGSQLGGYKFRRQHSVGCYILDFYCPVAYLAVELDGDSHFSDEAQAYDHERTLFLNSLNIHVLRFLNTDVHDNLLEVCTRILEAIKGRGVTP